LAFLDFGEPVILGGDLAHLSADFFACKTPSITPNPQRLPTEALNAY
jgi:hypothetical protein